LRLDDGDQKGIQGVFSAQTYLFRKPKLSGRGDLTIATQQFSVVWNGVYLRRHTVDYKSALRINHSPCGAFFVTNWRKTRLNSALYPGPVMDFASSLPAIEPAPAPVDKPPRWGVWTTLVWGVAIMATMVLFQAVGAVAFLTVWNRLHPEHAIPLSELGSNGPLLSVSVLVSAPATLAVIALAVKLSRVSFAEYLALKWPRWRDVGLGIGLLVAVLLTTGLVADLTGQETPAFIADTFNSARDAGLLPLLIFSFVILGPFQEEMMFRGFLFRGFSPRFGVWPTAVITAALWAIIHVQYEWFFMGEIFALGLVFGWLRAKSGSLLLTFGLHALVNGMAVAEAALMIG
jgi:uncharacterized protein